jgi:hypothetical protein
VAARWIHARVPEPSPEIGASAADGNASASDHVSVWSCKEHDQSTNVVFGVAQLSQWNLVEHRRKVAGSFCSHCLKGFRPDDAAVAQVCMAGADVADNRCCSPSAALKIR